MTMKCHVLSDGFDGSYFLDGVNVNYFSEGGHAPGQWFGGGTKSLQLQGDVDPDSLRQLLAGQHPRHPRSLVQRKVPRKSRKSSGRGSGSPTSREAKKKRPVEHRPGFDVQISFSKSLSAYWAVAPLDIRQRVEAAIDRGIKATFTYSEQELELTRRGKNGCRREKAKLVIAMFDHVTSRNGDPLLHRHCLVNNVCQRPDGSWGTIDSRTLHHWARTLGPLCRANVAAELRRDLGLELIEARAADGTSQGNFEVAGVPESLTTLWSSRRHDLIEYLEGQGEQIGDATSRAKERAAILSRPNKELTGPRDQVHAAWRQVAAKHGFTPEQAVALVGRAPQHVADPLVYERAWKKSLDNLTRAEAHFTERRLLQEVAEQLQTGQFTGTDIAQRVRADLEQLKDVVRLQDAGNDRCFTTQEMWQLEQKLLHDVQSLKERPGAQVSEKHVERALRRHPQLHDEQVQAVRTLLSSTSAIRAMTGVAGAGKSTTLKVVYEALKRSGFDPIGVALAGVAKEGLAAATGMPCRTVASLLRQLKKTPSEKLQERVKHDAKQYLRAIQGKTTYPWQDIALHAKSVVILDEAGMKDTRSLQRLLQHVEKAGATILMVGDTKQLQPIEAGGPFRRIVREVPTAHLAINNRQQDEQDRTAVAAVREGKIAQAFKNYVDRDRITIGENKRETLEKLVESWTKNGGARRPAEHVVFTQTRAEAAAANRLCQAARLDSAHTPHLMFARHGKDKFYRGDRLLFHQTDRRRGIENGYYGTVVSVDPLRRELKVRLDRQSQTVYGPRSPSGIVTIPLKEFKPDGLTLGYASTTHKNQGATVPHAYVMLGGRMTDNEIVYVQVTRAKKSTQLFVDRAHAGDELKDLITAVEKSNAKTMAHDHARRQPPTRGPELTLER